MACSPPTTIAGVLALILIGDGWPVVAIVVAVCVLGPVLVGLAMRLRDRGRD